MPRLRLAAGSSAVSAARMKRFGALHCAHEGQRPARHTPHRVRPPGVPGAAGGGRGRPCRRPRRGGAVPHRGRQVHLLSGAGAVPPGDRRRDLAADCADARPGGGAAPGGGQRGRAELVDEFGRIGPHPQGFRVRNPQAALCGARAPDDRRVPGPSRHRDDLALRHRRSPLRLGLGPRFPAGIPQAVDPQGQVPGHPSDSR